MTMPLSHEVWWVWECDGLRCASLTEDDRPGLPEGWHMTGDYRVLCPACWGV